MRLKSWASNLTLVLAAVMAIGLVTGINVRTQAPFLVFGSSSGSSQVIKSTSNALWVSIQGTVTGTLTATAYLIATLGMCPGTANKACIQSSSDSLLQVMASSLTTGIEFNVGIPTLGTCTGGTMTSGSHNTAGEVTGNTSGSCVINFGAPSFTNTPFCMTNDESSSIIQPNVSSRSASSITISGQASGNAVQWICIGRIGT